MRGRVIVCVDTSVGEVDEGLLWVFLQGLELHLLGVEGS